MQELNIDNMPQYTNGYILKAISCLLFAQKLISKLGLGCPAFV